MLTCKWTKATSWLVLPAMLLSASAVTCAAEDGQQGQSGVAWVYQVARAGQGEYWIGIMGAPIDSLLGKHLKIDAGVVVQHVVPDSPADKAGITEDDILLKFGDKKVGEVMDLAKAIAANKDKEAKITLMREGEEKVVAVTPAKRPDTIPMPPLPPATDLKKFKDWMEKLQKGELGEYPFRMWSMQPGVVIPREWKDFYSQPFWRRQFHLVLPKNTSVTITKANEGPARIVVKKDGQTWEVNEDELDKLPDDARQIVQGLLGRSFAFTVPGGGNFRFEWDGKRFKQPLRPAPKRTPDSKAESGKKGGTPSVDRDMDAVLKKLDEMNRRLREREKEMQDEIEKLRQQVEGLKKTEI